MRSSFKPFARGFFVASLFVLICCSVRYDRQIKKAESYFFQGEFDSAANTLRPLAVKSKKKDLLLYLLEAGLTYHTQGNYQKSNDIFLQADQLIQDSRKSISKAVLSFILSDDQQNFTGEKFEHLLVKFYIALNYIMLGDLESARRYFRKLNFELKDLKYFDASYKQNLMVRYLIAILSEHFKDYNDARVQYKNIRLFRKKINEIFADQYVLARKEKDKRDIRKFRRSGRKFLHAYNTDMKPTDYQPDMGELVIIHQAGKAAVKRSRGKLLNDEALVTSLHISIRAALIAQEAALTVSGVMATLGTAENPIPVYGFRDDRDSWSLQVALNDKDINSTRMFNDYSTTVLRNFNSQYKGMVAKNVASIAAKVVTAAVAAHLTKSAVSKSSKDESTGTFVGFLTGLFTGFVAGSTIKPDLRCWRFLPSNFQIKRIFLKPGEYRLQLKPEGKTSILNRNYPETIKIEKNKILFVNIRTI